MKMLVFLMIFIMSSSLCFAEEPQQKPLLKVYGTEDPFPAIRIAGDAFAAREGIRVQVVSEPSTSWVKTAQKDADVIYSSSENVMDDYNDRLGIIDADTVTTLFLRPAALIVRPGNPKKIKGIKDFISRDLKVIIVNGQGQVAMWEDIIGRLKDVEALREFRKHIAFTARTTSEALQYWKNHEEVDAWLTFNTWAKHEDVKGDLVPIGKDLVMYRSMGAAVTTITNQRELALKFIEFLKSAESQKIFKAEGWFQKEK